MGRSNNLRWIILGVLAACLALAQTATQQASPPTVTVTITMPKALSDVVWAKVRMERSTQIDSTGKGFA
ncbi:MAG: hypothetical protein M1541_16485, partial [Acidobacteria bacterium]|nr:hypothetical protein [Acidobacteriota bacterium]